MWCYPGLVPQQHVLTVYVTLNRSRTCDVKAWVPKMYVSPLNFKFREKQNTVFFFYSLNLQSCHMLHTGINVLLFLDNVTASKYTYILSCTPSKIHRYVKYCIYTNSLSFSRTFWDSSSRSWRAFSLLESSSVVLMSSQSCRLRSCRLRLDGKREAALRLPPVSPPGGHECNTESSSSMSCWEKKTIEHEFVQGRR